MMFRNKLITGNVADQKEEDDDVAEGGSSSCLSVFFGYNQAKQTVAAIW